MPEQNEPKMYVHFLITPEIAGLLESARGNIEAAIKDRVPGVVTESAILREALRVGLAACQETVPGR